jgi:hypothetical protein
MTTPPSTSLVPPPDRGRVPPQALEAERSVLGAMCLSRDAVARAMESLTASFLNTPTSILSVATVLAALAGFRVGAWIRQHLSDKLFRLILLWMILALGLRLVLLNLF